MKKPLVVALYAGPGTTIIKNIFQILTKDDIYGNFYSYMYNM